MYTETNRCRNIFRGLQPAVCIEHQLSQQYKVTITVSWTPSSDDIVACYCKQVASCVLFVFNYYYYFGDYIVVYPLKLATLSLASSSACCLLLFLLY